MSNIITRLSLWVVLGASASLYGCGDESGTAYSPASASDVSGQITQVPSSGSTPPTVTAATPATTTDTPNAGETSSPAPKPVPLPVASTSNVTLSWTAPDQNTDGSPLTNLSGFKIYYGTSPAQLTSVITVKNAGLSTYVVDGLNVGQTYYFAVSATTSDGMESTQAGVVSDRI